jgi:hypothetical protein
LEFNGVKYRRYEMTFMDTDRTTRNFIPYPTNRVVGTIAHAGHAAAAVNALLEAGFDRQSIDVLHGGKGLSRLDPTGAAHGVVERLQRALIRTGAPAEEYRHLMRHVDDVRAGRFVIMALAPEHGGRAAAADILDAHGAEFVGFYGRWAWQGLTAEHRSGSRRRRPSRGRNARPDDMSQLFVKA